jgi:hypothetical protein
MPCQQMLDERALGAVLGAGFGLTSANMSSPGRSQCAWQDAGNTPPRRVGIAFVDKRGFPATAPTPAGALEAAMASYVKMGLKPVAVPGLGEQAIAYTVGEAEILLIRRADGLLSVTGMGVTRELTIAVARRAVAAPTPALGAHLPFPAPAPVVAATPLSIAPAQRNLPCVRAVTADDVQSLGRSEVLVEIQNPRIGYSACEWRSSTADNSGFKVTVITREEFADARAANASAYLAAERKSGFAAPKPETLTGVGDEAFWFPGPAPMLMARKAEDVLQVFCWECSSAQIIAIAKLALGRLGVESLKRAKLQSEAAKGLTMPCLALLDSRSVTAAIGVTLAPTAMLTFAGESSCSWWTGLEPGAKIPFQLTFVDQRAFLNKAIFHTAAPSARGIYDFEIAARTRAGFTGEAIANLGEHATAFQMKDVTTLLVLRPDGVIRLVSSELPRQQLVALAARAARASPPLLGRHVDFPGPQTIAEETAMDLDADARTWSCVQMLTAAEVRAGKRTEVLTRAYGPRPGYSLCEWRATSAPGTGFNVAVATAPEFKALRLPGASAYFAAERQAMTTFLTVEPLYGLGADGIQADGSGQAVVMARTQDTIVTVSCFSCNRFDAIAIARLALIVK